MKRYHPITLIEVTIVMVLTAILLGTLFYTQTDMAKAKIKVVQAKTIVLGRQRFYLRLNQIFNSETHFRLEKNHLILKYDNGIDYQRSFSGPVTSMLYLEDKKVCLGTWAENEEWRYDVLLEGVENLAFKFFDNKKNEWCDTMPKEDFTLFKIIVDKEEFPFFL